MLAAGLCVVCAGLDNDPEKIRIHILEMLVKFRSEGVIEKTVPPNRCGSEALRRLLDYYPKIFFKSSSGVLIGEIL